MNDNEWNGGGKGRGRAYARQPPSVSVCPVLIRTGHFLPNGSEGLVLHIYRKIGLYVAVFFFLHLLPMRIFGLHLAFGENVKSSIYGISVPPSSFGLVVCVDNRRICFTIGNEIHVGLLMR